MAIPCGPQKRVVVFGGGVHAGVRQEKANDLGVAEPRGSADREVVLSCGVQRGVVQEERGHRVNVASLDRGEGTAEGGVHSESASGAL